MRARVQWRRNDEIGLGFTAVERAPDTTPSAGEVAQRVALLEAEIVALRALLKRLKRDKADIGRRSLRPELPPSLSSAGLIISPRQTQGE